MSLLSKYVCILDKLTFSHVIPVSQVFVAWTRQIKTCRCIYFMCKSALCLRKTFRVIECLSAECRIVSNRFARVFEQLLKCRVVASRKKTATRGVGKINEWSNRDGNAWLRFGTFFPLFLLITPLCHSHVSATGTQRANDNFLKVNHNRLDCHCMAYNEIKYIY